MPTTHRAGSLAPRHRSRPYAPAISGGYADHDSDAVVLAAKWVERRFRVPPRMAAVLADLAGLGGPAR